MSTALTLTVNKWAEVRRENDRDKHLIEPEQLEAWEKFEEKTTADLKAIIARYDGEKLSDSDEQYLRELNSTIDNATRVSSEELQAKKEAREEAERQRLEEERLRKEAEDRKKKEVENLKGSLLDQLG